MPDCRPALKTLFDAPVMAQNFSSIPRLFPSRPIDRGSGKVSTLPDGPHLELPLDAEAWLDAQQVTSFLVLQHGKIRHQSYRLGTGPEDLRMSWSIAKSVMSLLVGALLEEGIFDDLDAPLVRFAPKLSDSAYTKVTLRQALMMTSGVSFDEDYLAHGSDINRLGRYLTAGRGMDDFVCAMTERHSAPGACWAYASTDTHALGMAIRGATGAAVPALLSKLIFAPMGLEAEPRIVTDAHGTAIVLGGLTMRTRDYARLGQMVLQGGAWQGRQIVPRDWITRAATPLAETPSGQPGYGYQWWIPQNAARGEVMACGIYGQYIHIAPARDTVIVITSANRNFGTPGVFEGHVALCRSLTAANGQDANSL